LKALGLVIDENGTLKRTAKNLSTSQDVTSLALQKAHKQLLAKAAAAIDEVDIKHRNVSALIFPCDPKLIPEAREMLREFGRRLASFLESGNSTEVYTLNLQLFPLSRSKEPESHV
jgi:uncharacterized protein (TIGR02147 family)